MNDGKSFEREVADAFSALGYKVEMDIQIGGKQIDLVAHLKSPGISNDLKLYVECKDYNKSNLQSEDVDKFSYSYSRVKKCDNKFTGGVLVTRKPLHSRVKESLVNEELSTITLSALENEKTGELKSLRDYISSYELNEDNKVYIPLKYSETNKRKDLLSYTNKWLVNDGTLLVLLGDFGTGKSTYLKRLKYELADSYVEEDSNLIPLYIMLKNFDSYQNVESFFESQLRAEFGRNIRFEEFSQLSKYKDFLILLDGFDEMGLHIDSGKRKKHFEQLIQIISRSKKAILTCRPAYFLSQREMTNVLNILKPPIDVNNRTYTKNLRVEYTDFADSVFTALSNEKKQKKGSYYSVLKLSGFSTADIDEYLNKFYPDQSDEYKFNIRERIRNTYDLEDLAKRPILLFLIASSLPNLSETAEATPSLIYLVYTSAWMKRDEDKGDFRKLITQDKKRDFVCQLAWRMYESNSLELSYKELPKIVQDYFSGEKETHQVFVTHIQSCAFLNRDDSDVFRFAHKSFMEYFAALHLANYIINKCNFDLLESFEISKELSFFLGDMSYTQPDLLVAIETKFLNSIKISSPASSKLKSNLLSVYSHSRKPFPKTRIYDLQFSNLDFLKNTFSSVMEECTFDSVNFKECIFKDLEVKSFTSVNTNIGKGSKLKKVNFYYKNKGNFLTIEGSSLNEVKIEGDVAITIGDCNIDAITFYNLKKLSIVESSVKNSEFDTSKLEGRISGTDVNKSLFYNPDYRALGKISVSLKKLQLDNIIFSNCIFVLVNFSLINFNRCKFVKCKLIGCSFGYLDGKMHVPEMEFKKCQFIFSNISNSSWHEVEKNKLSVKKSEYYEELNKLYKLKSSNEKYVEAYKQLEALPPILPPEPSNLADTLIKNIDSCIESNKISKKVEVDEDSLPYSENVTDSKWTSFGLNLNTIFLKYLGD
jgi:uncharacterized protein YjbI with pentapeptide repeats